MINIGNAVDVSASASGYFLNGGSKSLIVDGSTTPVLFEVPLPDDGKDYAVTSIAMTFNSTAALVSGLGFMDQAALTNGVTYGYIRRSDDAEIAIRGPIQTNIDMFARDPRAKQYSMTGNDEVLSIEVQGGFNFVINANEARSIYVAINDSLLLLLAGEAYAKVYRVIPSHR